MCFIRDIDYKIVIGEAALKVVSQADQETRANAELEAVEEISGYLRPKYDCDRIFGAEGDERNRQILMFACDIALYHMAASLPGRMGMEIREKRYENALERLRQIQSGVVIPNLPEATDDAGESAAPSIRFGSKPCIDNSY